MVYKLVRARKQQCSKIVMAVREKSMDLSRHKVTALDNNKYNINSNNIANMFNI